MQREGSGKEAKESSTQSKYPGDGGKTDWSHPWGPWSSGSQNVYLCLISICFSQEGKPCSDPEVLKATHDAPLGHAIEVGNKKLWCQKTSPACSRKVGCGEEPGVGSWQEMRSVGEESSNL